jgi:hypothetical protein
MAKLWRCVYRPSVSYLDGIRAYKKQPFPSIRIPFLDTNRIHIAHTYSQLRSSDQF